MKNIRRSKKAEDIIASAKVMYAYTLGNCFVGETINLEDRGGSWMLSIYKSMRRAKLRQISENRFSLRIHSNEWYEFTI